MNDGLGGLEWTLVLVGVIAASAAIVALGLVVGQIGIAGAVLAARLGRFLRDAGEDLVRAVGSLAVALILVPVAIARGLVPGGRGIVETLRAAGREALEGLRALRSALLVRPLVLIGLSSLVGRVAARLPAAMADDGRGSARDPSSFPGYRLLRELPRGGSGARVLVAEPDDSTRRRIGLARGFVVIKSFDFDDGTHLAEMLRESRALEAARRLKLVLDHEASERRFHYVMRFHEGVDLGRFVRSMHEAAGGEQAALDRERLLLAASLVRDLVATLRDWHASGLWHKDVKPENAIVHGGRATLIDLSLVTPLASQMTLTTHGTEYYRDPELVRHALRGTRVSDVDAARFDIYGAGAVLYFALEGTFPAHGALSGFRKASPESLRWIVRRAMADFDRRYPDAAAMLRDLDAAISGGDPAAVRPADLPSMRGADGLADHRSDEEKFLYPDAAPAVPPPAPDAERSERPRVRVTDWWLGAYEVRSIRPLPAEPPGMAARGIGAALAVLAVSLIVLAAAITALILL